MTTWNDPIERESCPCCRGDQGWHRRKGPASVLRARHGLGPLSLPGWADHPYRLRCDDGSWCWVAEPYELGPEAFADFRHLEESGFSVHITAWRARHYPGHTMAVTIKEAGPESL